LQGAALARRPDRRGAELPSEPLVTGAVQVPPSGQPVIFLADHPTTGGYPVVGVVLHTDLPALAQARPGSTVRMRAVES
jgi:allophanate hydrolase subunit 2